MNVQVQIILHNQRQKIQRTTSKFKQYMVQYVMQKTITNNNKNRWRLNISH